MNKLLRSVFLFEQEVSMLLPLSIKEAESRIGNHPLDANGRVNLKLSHYGVLIEKHNQTYILAKEHNRSQNYRLRFELKEKQGGLLLEGVFYEATVSQFVFWLFLAFIFLSGSWRGFVEGNWKAFGFIMIFGLIVYFMSLGFSYYQCFRLKRWLSAVFFAV